MPNERLQDLTMEELIATQQGINAEREALKQQAHQIQAMIDLKTSMAKVANLSEAEKAALMQAIQAQAIPSGESVGKPGA